MLSTKEKDREGQSYQATFLELIKAFNELESRIDVLEGRLDFVVMTLNHLDQQLTTPQTAPVLSVVSCTCDVAYNGGHNSDCIPGSRKKKSRKLA